MVDVVSNGKLASTAFCAFIESQFSRADLAHLCKEKGSKVTGSKKALVQKCLQLYPPAELMKRSKLAQTLSWHAELIIAALLPGEKRMGSILDCELACIVFAQELPAPAFGEVTRRLLSAAESRSRFARRVYQLRRSGVILLDRGTRAYRINPLMKEYLNEIFGSISGDDVLRDIEDYVSTVIGERFSFQATRTLPQLPVKDIGKGSWSDAPFKTWVSKTEVAQFLRCKYRVFVVHTRNLSLDEVRDARTIRFLLQRGSQFENSLIAGMPFEEVASLESVIDKNVIFRTPEIIQNHELGIRGIVDLILVEEGKLYPVEIKYHRYVSESDRLELAFYWKLLQPLRRGEPGPKGFVLLNTGEFVEVALVEKDFVTLDRLLTEIRDVKEVGTEPILCSECGFCNLRGECVPRVREKDGLSSVHGIGPVRHEELLSLGIKDARMFAMKAPEELYPVWRQLTPHAPTVREIRQMQTHVRSLQEGRPIYFGSTGFPVGRKLLIIDLEYDNFACIWLLGLLASDMQRTQCYQLFADEMNQEKENLVRFAALLKQYTRHQIITWDGLRADLPQLEAAWRRHGLPSKELEQLKRRHRDFYQFFLRNCRLPLVSFGLKEVGGYFGFKRKYEYMDGIEAQMLYHQYLETRMSSIKHKLLEYNREDLEATLFVVDRLRSLANGERLWA